MKNIPDFRQSQTCPGTRQKRARIDKKKTGNTPEPEIEKKRLKSAFTAHPDDITRLAYILI